MTVVLDYGMGNLASVEKALRHLGHECRREQDLADASRLILPGVGAFGAAMAALGSRAESIAAFARSGRPVLGICLGQQLLFEEGEEHGRFGGLGLLAGRVVRLPGEGVKIPHIGWNELHPPHGATQFSSPMLQGIEPGEQVYFVHSYHCVAAERSDVAAMSRHGMEFVAAVQRDNVWGCQFHPEKSGAAGLRILENFLRWN